MKSENTRKAFGETLRDLARKRDNIVAVSADTYKSMRVDIMREEFPERCFEVGIAEQNMIMVAAGLAATGKTVFAASYSVFTSMRSLEQLRTFVAYPNLDVKVVAGLGGFSSGIEGVTHVAMEDIGVIRCIPGVAVVNPADAVATRKAITAAADYFGPVYIRIGRDDSPVIFDEDYQFRIGKANLLRDNGTELTIVVTGGMVLQALEAVDWLEKDGIGVRLMEIHTIKPLDTAALVTAAKATGAILAVEEHNCIGGLGSAVAEVLARSWPVPLEQVAVEDIFTESGSPDELREHYGLTTENICRSAKRVLGRKRSR